MSMMDLMLDRRSTSLSNVVDTFDATHIISTAQYIAFHYTSSWFGNEKALAAFDEEVAILRSVRHPWLLTPTEVIEDDRERLLCYKPFQPGPALDKSWGKLDDEMLLPLFEGLSEMAAMFHMKGAFCYFDPAVLFVSSPLKVQWLRLPRAFLADTTMPSSGGIFGSPGFRSPGQVRGDAMQPADDFFVLGSMLLAAKTGIPPFDGNTPANALIKIIEGVPNGLEHERVTPGFRDLIQRLQHPEEARRLIDPDDIYERLQVAFGRKPFVPEPEVTPDLEPPAPESEPEEAKEPAPSHELSAQVDTPKPATENAVDTPSPQPAVEKQLESAPDAADVDDAGDSDDIAAADGTESTGSADADDDEEVSEDTRRVPVEEPSAPALQADGKHDKERDGDLPDTKEGSDISSTSSAPSDTKAVEQVPAELTQTPAQEEQPPASASESEESSEISAAAQVTPAPAFDSPDVPGVSEKVPSPAVTAPVVAPVMEEIVPEPAPDAPASALTPVPIPANTPASTETPIPSAFLPPSLPSAPVTPPPFSRETDSNSGEDATQEIPLSSEADDDLTDAEQSQLEKAKSSAKRQDSKKKRKKKRTDTMGIFAGLIEEAVKADQSVEEEEVPVIVREESPSLEEAADDVGTRPSRRATVAFGAPMDEFEKALAGLVPPAPAQEESEGLADESLALLEPMAPPAATSPADTAEVPAVAPATKTPPAPSAPGLSFQVPKETPLGAAGASSSPARGPQSGKAGLAPSVVPPVGNLRKNTGAADTLISPAPVEVKAPVLELPPEFDSASDLDALPREPSPLDKLEEPRVEDEVDVALNEMADFDGEFNQIALDESVGAVRLDESPAESTLQSGPPPSIPQKPMPTKGKELVPDEAIIDLDEHDPKIEALLPPKEPILPAPTEDTVLVPEDPISAGPTAKLPVPQIAMGQRGPESRAPAPPAPLAPQLTPQELSQAAKKPNERQVKVLRRKGVVRYYKQMNPTRIFPLLVSILEAEMYIKLPELTNVVQEESDKIMEIKETSPLVRIVPVIPGCLVSPPEAIVDVRQKKVDTEFWIAPQCEGDLSRSARVQIWHDGVLKDEIKLPTRVVRQTLTRITGTLSVFSTFGGVFVKAYGTAQPPTANTGISAQFAKSLVGVFSASGMWLGLFFFLTAIICYFWLKPREGDEIESFLSSDLH